MKHWAFLVLLICFATPVSAQEPRDPWHWILTEAVRGHWETRQGVAGVEISGGSVHIRLARIVAEFRTAQFMLP
jgi:hypothetical protein